ncbi:MAG: hypothetical protein P4M11_02905 [Candidatus Pacebacteria bacterium]|nr:hypothetical protein [Candidatus Paceibacterota bacterium]
MGNSFAKALSKGLKFLSHEVVKLSDNRLTEEGTLALIRQLKPSVKYLDLSYNVFGAVTARELGDFIKSRANRYH